MASVKCRSGVRPTRSRPASSTPTVAMIPRPSSAWPAQKMQNIQHALAGSGRLEPTTGSTLQPVGTPGGLSKPPLGNLTNDGLRGVVAVGNAWPNPGLHRTGEFPDIVGGVFPTMECIQPFIQSRPRTARYSAPGSAPGQQQPALEMVRIGELVEHRGGAHCVRGLQGGDVFLQGLRVAGDVQDIFETGGQFERRGIQSTAWRVDEKGRKAVAARGRCPSSA